MTSSRTSARSTTTKKGVLGLVAAFAFTASAVCFLWAVFVLVFVNGMFASGDTHPAESPDLLTPILLGMTSAGGGIYALVKRMPGGHSGRH